MQNKRHSGSLHASNATASAQSGSIPIKEYNQLFDSNIDLLLFHASITQSLNIDAVVNSTGSHFEHNGGSSRAIVTSAGPAMLIDFQDYLNNFKYMDFGQVFVSESHNLSSAYKKILSVRSPGSQSCIKQPDLMELTFYNLIEKSFIELDLKSLATPLISTGINNVPIDRCVNALINSIKKFVNKIHPKFDPSLKRRICIVEFNSNILNQASSILDKTIPVKNSPAPLSHSILAPSTPSAQPASVKSEADNGLSIKVKKIKNDNEKETCAICLETVGSEPNTHEKKLDKCGHSFCNTCIDNYFSNVKKTMSCLRNCVRHFVRKSTGWHYDS